MTTTETSPATKHPQATSRHIGVDERFARLLAEDFSIAEATVLDALVDEPQKQAIASCSRASRQDDPARALTAWARKHGRGRCRRAPRPPGRSSRRHGETPPGRSVDTGDRRRRVDSPTREEVAPERRGDSLRGVLVDAGTLERIAERLGVS